jgi:hypothetical protein
MLNRHERVAGKKWVGYEIRVRQKKVVTRSGFTKDHTKYFQMVDDRHDLNRLMMTMISSRWVKRAPIKCCE